VPTADLQPVWAIFLKPKKLPKNFDPHAFKRLLSGTRSRPDVMDEMKW
jgi:hypothetical protein